MGLGIGRSNDWNWVGTGVGLLIVCSEITCNLILYANHLTLASDCKRGLDVRDMTRETGSERRRSAEPSADRTLGGGSSLDFELRANRAYALLKSNSQHPTASNNSRSRPEPAAAQLSSAGSSPIAA